MSIECKACLSENPDDSTVCTECGAELPKKANNSIWKIRCPVDGKIFDVPNYSFRCEECPYKDEVINGVSCVPFEVEDHEDIGAPQLIIQLINAVFDKQYIAHPSSKSPRFIGNSVTVTDRCVLGRAGDTARKFFANDFYISKEHCEIFFENGNWYVKQLSGTNPTMVDEVPVGLNDNRKIHSGSLLQMSDKLLLLTIVQPKEQKSVSLSKNESAEKAEIEKWVIICPNCGKKYTVDSPTDRILSCDNCDVFYKDDISSVRAVKSNVGR